MGQGFCEASIEKPQTRLLLQAAEQVIHVQFRFEQELQSMRINNYENAFTIEPDLAASANIIVGKKEDVQILTARTKSNANPLEKPHP